ncbi:RING/U-box protein with C6HC-type zinc finger [Hirschfeldia incana]|nr:RING/U-box protein with C6HC-type zinc finger [Hirschfeldia incana]
MEEHGTLVREDDPKSFCDISSESCRLYFKGLVREQTTTVLAGFGVAICDKDNNILFQMKEPLHDSAITDLEAELMALRRGLTEAVRLGITHISVYCDYQSIFELVVGRSVPEQDNIALLMDDVQRIRQKLAFSIPVLVTEDQTKLAYNLAMETVVSEIRINMPPGQKMTCPICFDDDFEAHQMFSVDSCCHYFCLECVRRYINVALMEGSVLGCPHFKCKSRLTLTSCSSLLTPKIREMWQQRINEESIPVVDRVYCPNPRCSALMTSEIELSKSPGSMRSCIKCDQPVCIKCKVAWHCNLSCEDYKRLGPNPTENDIKLKALANQKRWRQCGRCQHMIQLSYGCNKIVCSGLREVAHIEIGQLRFRLV